MWQPCSSFCQCTEPPVTRIGAGPFEIIEPHFSSLQPPLPIELHFSSISPPLVLRESRGDWENDDSEHHIHVESKKDTASVRSTLASVRSVSFSVRSSPEVNELSVSTLPIVRNELSVSTLPTLRRSKKVNELSERGLTLDTLFKFYMELPHVMPHFRANRSTTRDVVRGAVIPLTRDRGCAYATSAGDGKRIEPEKMITHHWGNLFAHTVAAIVADALGESTFGSIAMKLGIQVGVQKLLANIEKAGIGHLAYWVCAFGVNQHCTICAGFGGAPEMDTVTGQVYSLCDCGVEKHFSGDDCEVDKFQDMMAEIRRRHPSFGQVVAVDTKFDIFGRAWCVAELVQASNSGMRQALKICSTSTVRANRAKLHALDIRDCQASRPEDRNAILDAIADADAFNAQLRGLLLDAETGLFALAGAAKDLVLAWDSFTPEYAEQLREEATLDPTPILTVTIIPIICGLLQVTPQVCHPEKGWKDNFVFFCVVLFLVFFTQAYLFPQWLFTLVDGGKNNRLQLRANAFRWCVLLSLTVCITAFVLCVSLDSFPCPFVHLGFAGLLFGPTGLPSLYFAYPLDVRKRRDIRVRMVYAIVTMASTCAIFGFTYPLLISWFVRLDILGQALCVLLLFFLRLLNEGVGHIASKQLGADAMPVVVFFSVYAFQIQHCKLTAMVASPLILVELVLLDIFENIYYFDQLRRTHPAKASEEEYDQAKSVWDRVLTLLLVRELLENIVPWQFLVLHLATYPLQPKLNDLYNGVTSEEFDQMTTYVVCMIIAEVVIFSTTCLGAWKMGGTPLRTMRAVVAVHLQFAIGSGMLALGYHLGLQNACYGADLTFTFAWVGNPDAHWQGGLNWT